MKPNTSKSRDKVAGRLLTFSFVANLVILVIFAIFKFIVPSTRSGWSVIPIVDAIFLLGFLFCFICIAGIYGFQSWTKNADEYYEWFTSMGKSHSSYSRFVHSLFPKWMYLWAARTAPIFLFMVLSALGPLFLLSISSSGIP